VTGSGGLDLSYPHAAARTADHFFELDPGKLPWIAAVDAAGVGLLQVSSRRLRGWKLFTWGNTPGGRRWQEFLTGSTESYFEIQAGLTRTQLEHVPLGSGESWSWSEVYGPVSVPVEAVHGEWVDAIECMESAIAEARIGSMLEERAGAEHDRHGEPLHAGSGWGRSSRFGVRCRRRNPRRASIACSPVPALAKTRSRGLPSWKRASCRLERRAPMLLPSPARTFSKGRRTRPQRCCTGVVRWNASDLHAAVEAWEAAYALEPDSWLALRNIAAASGLLGEPERSAEQYLRALDLTPDVAQLRLEAIEALIAVNRFSEAVALAQAAPESSFAGRFRFLQAWAAVLHGEIRLAESILEGGLEVADLREGEVSLSDLWRICRRRCIETGGDCRLHQAPPGVASAHSDVPFIYDFRPHG